MGTPPAGLVDTPPPSAWRRRCVGTRTAPALHLRSGRLRCDGAAVGQADQQGAPVEFVLEGVELGCIMITTWIRTM